jgi:hypothetical protein
MRPSLRRRARPLSSRREPAEDLVDLPHALLEEPEELPPAIRQDLARQRVGAEGLGVVAQGLDLEEEALDPRLPARQERLAQGLDGQVCMAHRWRVARLAQGLDGQVCMAHRVSPPCLPPSSRADSASI